MPIKCNICNKDFPNQITNSHLKTHGITTSEYKERFGDDSLSSTEYREKLSKKRSGTNNPMYGKTHSDNSKRKISKNRAGKVGRTGPISEEGKQNMQKGVTSREEKYNSGKLERYKHSFSEPEKRKISESVKRYAKNNPEKLSIRGSKAHQTAIENGNWIAPMERLKNTNPEKYEEFKRESAKRIMVASEIRSDRLNNKIKQNIKDANLDLMESSKSPVTGLYVYNLKCNNCTTEFSYTRQYFTDSKFNPDCCPTCFPRNTLTSAGEDALYEFITDLGIDAQRNVRTVLDGRREIDIYVPESKLAIEYNGLYWHSQEVLRTAGKDKQSDYHKLLELNDKDITLITVFEDEWIYARDIVKSILKYKLGKLDNRIYARKCRVSEISTYDAKSFLNINHIKGYNKSNVKLGLYLNDTLVSVMTFSRSNISRRSNGWEIDRFANLINSSVVGGASKLWSHFLKLYDPDNVVSYADRRWSSGNLYDMLGFNHIKYTTPGYWYFCPNEKRRIHRFTLRKNDADDPNLTEYENRLKDGYLRIWDCGNSKWEWKKPR